MRLLLLGDDEALDLLAEFSRHLPLAELSRQDAMPERALDERDVVVVGGTHVRTRDALLRSVMAQGTPRHLVALVESRFAEDAGARAILVAAELVRVLLPALLGPPAS